MAQQLIFTCGRCGFEVDAWDEGNPYVEGPDGVRHHFYHPGEDRKVVAIVTALLGRAPTGDEVQQMLREHGGNEGDFLCLECRAPSRRNEREAAGPCASCGSTRVVERWHLAGETCPACKQGTFNRGRAGAIS